MYKMRTNSGSDALAGVASAYVAPDDVHGGCPCFIVFLYKSTHKGGIFYQHFLLAITYINRNNHLGLRVAQPGVDDVRDSVDYSDASCEHRPLVVPAIIPQRHLQPHATSRNMPIKSQRTAKCFVSLPQAAPIALDHG